MSLVVSFKALLSIWVSYGETFLVIKPNEVIAIAFLPLSPPSDKS